MIFFIEYIRFVLKNSKDTFTEYIRHKKNRWIFYSYKSKTREIMTRVKHYNGCLNTIITWRQKDDTLLIYDHYCIKRNYNKYIKHIE